MGYPSKFISLVYSLKFYTPHIIHANQNSHPAVERCDSPGAQWRRNQGREGMHSDHPRERRGGEREEKC